MKRFVVGLGEVLWDVLPEGKKLGGAPANFAYHAGQFLGRDNTIAISALGEDQLADETIEALKEHGLNDLLPRVPYPTGTVQVTLAEGGIPTYDIKENVAWDNIPLMRTSDRLPPTVGLCASVHWHSATSSAAPPSRSSWMLRPKTA